MAKTKKHSQATATTAETPFKGTAGKKRAAASTPSTDEAPPSKRRKAAEAGRAKVKKMAEAEEDFSDDEVVMVKGKGETNGKARSKTKAAEPESEEEETDVEELETHAIQAPPVVAPGFRLWNTTSKLASKGELSQLSKFDESKEEFAHVLKIKNDEAFTLMPLIVTQGPYKGRRVFMLEPTTGFRFMDFPPEIRNLVYSCLLEYDGPIKMMTKKKVNEPRRPVMASELWNGKTKKWVKQTHASLTVLRASKQVLEEAAPIMYGNNHFRFSNLGDMKIFADRVGSMRAYIRHIDIGSWGYPRTKARAAFNSLKDAVDLRTLSFFHTNICQEIPPHYYPMVSPRAFVSQVINMLKVLNRAHKISQSQISVLDLVKVDWTRCEVCAPLAPEFPEDAELCRAINMTPSLHGGRCSVKCKNLNAHCKEVEKKIRGMISNALNIEE